MLTPTQEAFLAAFADKELAILAKGQIEKAQAVVQADRETVIANIKATAEAQIQDAIVTYDKGVKV